MFTSSYPGPRQTTAYRQIGAATAVDGASPHKLVSLLFNSVLGEIATARGALARRQISEKGRAIAHAIRVIEEGLKAPLDMTAGGLATNLDDLYAYVVHQLTMANINNDDAALRECGELIETLRDGWEGIADQADAHNRLDA